MRIILVTFTLIAIANPLAAQQPIKQAAHISPAKAAVLPRRDARKLPEAAQPIYYSALSAAEWLKRANKPDGSFVYGFQPSLRMLIDGDNFVSQAGSAHALARSARYFRDEAGTAKARQAILTLLVQTVTEGNRRRPAVPDGVVNPLAATGLLISAIHELARVEDCKDLLEHADQMCNFLLARQWGVDPIGSGIDSGPLITTRRDLDESAGLALRGLIRSQKLRPSESKLTLVRKARDRYAKVWQSDKSYILAVNHMPAYAEAFVQTKDAAYSELVFTMADWLVGVQISERYDSPRKHWTGGFPRFTDGKQEAGAPDITSALAGESLAEACRVAKAVGDLPRLQRYERALIANLHFLMSLQYNGLKTEHFVEAFRPSVLGAFHGSHQDGNLKLDYTLHPLLAMVQYLDSVVE